MVGTFSVLTVVAGKQTVHISLSICKYDVQMHMKIPFPMRVVSNPNPEIIDIKLILFK